MLVTATSQGLTVAQQRESEQITADFAEYLSADDTEEDLLHKITKNGVRSLIEHKIDQLKKKLTEDAMASRGVSAESLADMPEEERLAMMKDIMDEVARLLKQQFSEQMQRDMEAQMKRKNDIDVMFSPVAVNSDAMRELLSAQQFAKNPAD